ncbi:hypothetical protein C2E19_14185 [Pseudomonas sp. DTU12.3]|uniref:hypothetical protein n=1 Tax=Pseudomonas sp. DTU12.3 TaxID=2073078 RepID=UPI00101139B8|nr:hypothetical protein [Pseudomonas sp. DTU12.3]QAX84935.1 hypothetical protein C2E19_14185 [Pseudomonas sp. DTU12.3]
MNKVVYVPAKFKPVGKEVTVKIPTGETKKGFFGGLKEVTVKDTEWQQTGWSDCEIDGEVLSQDIASAVAELNAEGYEVVAIQPIISGAYDYKWDKYSSADTGASTCYSYGYGYSYTEGTTIIAKKVITN